MKKKRMEPVRKVNIQSHKRDILQTRQEIHQKNRGDDGHNRGRK